MRPFRVNFAAAPGSKQAQDTIVDVADLVAATGCGERWMELSIFCLVAREASFAARMVSYLQVIDAVPAAAARTRILTMIGGAMGATVT